MLGEAPAESEGVLDDEGRCSGPAIDEIAFTTIIFVAWGSLYGALGLFFMARAALHKKKKEPWLLVVLSVLLGLTCLFRAGG